MCECVILECPILDRVRETSSRLEFLLENDQSFHSFLYREVYYHVEFSKRNPMFLG